MVSHDKRHRQRREQARERGKQWAAQQAFDSAPYPDIVVDPTGGSPDFVAAVRRVLESFSFDDPECCAPMYQKHYKVLGGFGAAHWHEALPHLIGSEVPGEVEARAALSVTTYAVVCHLGEWIFQRLPAEYTALPLPRYFFCVTLIDTELRIGFEFLETVGDPTNPLYIPTKKPTVIMQGTSWSVALYRHAVERMCQRLCGTPTYSYGQCLNIYMLLTGNGLLFEHVYLAGRADALRVSFELPTVPGISSYYDLYVKKVFGEENIVPGKGALYALAGYLPLHIQGKYARAVTFLFPGYGGTPEDQLARKGVASPSLRKVLVEMAEDNTSASVVQGETLDAIKWYHENGAPQVFYRSANNG